MFQKDLLYGKRILITSGGKAVNSAPKRKRPDSVRVIGRSSNSPPPKSAHHLLYNLIAAGGMARKGESYRTIW
jgi:hypothetical protein